MENPEVDGLTTLYTDTASHQTAVHSSFPLLTARSKPAKGIKVQQWLSTTRQSVLPQVIISLSNVIFRYSFSTHVKAMLMCCHRERSLCVVMLASGVIFRYLTDVRFCKQFINCLFFNFYSFQTCSTFNICFLGEILFLLDMLCDYNCVTVLIRDD